MTSSNHSTADCYLVQGYLPTIGIESHVQLASHRKLFTPIANSGQPMAVNSRLSPLCLGLPGSLPVVDPEAIRLALVAGLALEARIAPQTQFDRKHYFYPDLPLGYQITQHQQPIIDGGAVSFYSTDLKRSKSVSLVRAHLEADAGKLSHPAGADYSLLDLNRVGSALLEVVSQPQIHSPAEARDYSQALQRLMVYAGVSQGNLEQAQMRFDVNISLARPGQALGARVEIKNLNSFRFIYQAVSYEIDRQLKLLLDGQAVDQETRGYNEAGKTTFSQRSKEAAPDYRYMPEPDIPPVVITSADIETARQRLPVLPAEIEPVLIAAGLPRSQVQLILETPVLARWLMTVVDGRSPAATAVAGNWLAGEITSLIKTGQIDWARVIGRGNDLLTLAQAVDSGRVSLDAVKGQLGRLLTGQTGIDDLIGQLSQAAEAARTELGPVIEKVCQQQPKAVADCRRDSKVLGFLIGQVRRQMPAADPNLVRVQLKKVLGLD